MRLARILLPALLVVSTAYPFTKSGTTYTTTGAQADVNAAIVDATTGDTVVVPTGTFTWGASTTSVLVNKAITLTGVTAASSTINISATGWTYSAGGAVVVTSPGAVVKNLTFTQPGGANTTAICSTAPNGVLITDCVYNSATTVGYFLYTEGYGCLAATTINLNDVGTDECVFMRGPTNSWQTASSYGTADAWIIEDCVYNFAGYVCDMNANARGVVRFCLIQSSAKVDGHGAATNTPRGVRHGEIYGCAWTFPSGFNTAIEIRGGNWKIFDNTALGTQGKWFFLRDYGYAVGGPYFSGVWQGPGTYPITDQIGVGIDPKAAHSERTYIWNNLKNSAAWPRELSTVAPGAITANGSSFDDTTVIQEDRDVFASAGFGAWSGTFTGAHGVGRGTYAAMLLITPSVTGVGYYATDVGEWNANHSGADGQFYVWNGSAWVLDYTPYTYPHPLRSGGGGGGSDTTAPTPNPATIASATATGQTTATVVATTATDSASSPVQYRFSNDAGSSWTEWQLGATYNWTGLTAGTLYHMKVQTEDSATTPNTTTASSSSDITTDASTTLTIRTAGKTRTAF